MPRSGHVRSPASAPPADVAALTTLKRDTLYGDRCQRIPEFAAPIRISRKRLAWDLDAVERWITQRAMRSESPRD